jgi:hypothetical protein
VVVSFVSGCDDDLRISRHSPRGVPIGKLTTTSLSRPRKSIRRLPMLEISTQLPDRPLEPRKTAGILGSLHICSAKRSRTGKLLLWGLKPVDAPLTEIRDITIDTAVDRWVGPFRLATRRRQRRMRPRYAIFLEPRLSRESGCSTSRPREMSDLSPQTGPKRTLRGRCHQPRFYDYTHPRLGAHRAGGPAVEGVEP